MNVISSRMRMTLACSTMLALVLAACSDATEEQVVVKPSNPTEAATQVEQVFEDAPMEVQQAVQAAADGMREEDYEKAVVSLQALRSQENLTLEQGMAVHHSMVALEKQLIQRMQAGDPQAKRAYETLKRMKRN